MRGSQTPRKFYEQLLSEFIPEKATGDPKWINQESSVQQLNRSRVDFLCDLPPEQDPVLYTIEHVLNVLALKHANHVRFQGSTNDQLGEAAQLYQENEAFREGGNYNEDVFLKIFAELVRSKKGGPMVRAIIPVDDTDYPFFITFSLLADGFIAISSETTIPDTPTSRSSSP